MSAPTPGRTRWLPPGAAAEIDAVAQLMLETNVKPRHCIQSDTEHSPAEIASELRRLHGRGELLLGLAGDAPLAGVLGCEMDPISGRGWLRGPHAQSAAWTDIARALVLDLLDRLPPGILRLDSFLNVTHEEGNSLYRSLGFREVRRVHLYVATPPGPGAQETPAAPFSPEYTADVAALHDALFPNTYISGQRICENQDADQRVFVVAEGPRALGYVAVNVQHGGNGFVQFLGVAPDARGRGVARRLLGTAARWLLVERGAREVSLTVDDENVDARSLYASSGFRLRYTGVNMRWEV